MYNSISKIDYRSDKFNFSKKVLNFLQYSDGLNRLEDISKKINLNFKETKLLHKILKQKRLVI